MLEWSDKMGSRSRKAWLLFIRGDYVFPFKGDDIPGVVVVRGKDYTRNGKWSHDLYRLEVAYGVRHIAGHEGWETGRFVEGLRDSVGGGQALDTWSDLAKALGVSVPGAMEFLRSWRPKAAEALDQVEASLMALEEEASTSSEDAETVMVTVSFGAPNRRAAEAGFWKTPKPVPGYEAKIRLLDNDKGWYKPENIEVDGMSGKVLDVRWSSGMRGGYCAVTVALVPGTEAKIPPETAIVETVTGTKDPVDDDTKITTFAEAFRKAGLA